MTNDELMRLRLLRDIDRKVTRTWLSDFGSNIAGNAVWSGALWLLSKLVKKL